MIRRKRSTPPVEYITLQLGWCDRCGRDFEVATTPKSLCPPCYNANAVLFPHFPEISSGGFSGC